MKEKATPEQIQRAKERRAKTRGFAKQIAAMSEDERNALVSSWPTTIEGHRVSFKNACLIAFQGGATVIGGLKQWRTAGRKVSKGGRSVQIFVPLGIGKIRRDEESGEECAPDTESPQGYGIASVFDISQTEPIEAKPNDHVGASVIDVALGRVDVLALAGSEVCA